MPVTLPKNLATLATLTTSDRPRCPAVIRVLNVGSGIYRVEVTDGRRLAIVRGPCPRQRPAALDVPVSEETEVLVPVADWQSAFRLGRKSDAVGLTSDGDRFTLAVGSQAIVGAVPGGPFPATEAVLPQEPAVLALPLDPALLAGLLRVASALGCVGGVKILWYGPGKPVGLVARNDQGQYLDALLMPGA